MRAQRSGGGLVTALRDLVRHSPGTRWLCAATSDADRSVAQTASWLPVALGDGASARVHMVDVPADVHHDFYAVIANPLLWFIQHYLWDHGVAPEIGPREHAAWDRGYVVVNEMFTDAIAGGREPAAPGSLVMVHDYHFYLVPGLLRVRRPDLFVHLFVHIPWPQPDAWRVLPPRMRNELLEGMLGSDIVAFHTERYARNFLWTCQELLDREVDFRTATVRNAGRDVAVRHYPISVDEDALQVLATSPEVAEHGRAIDAQRAEHLILRVDRTDPSKNIVRGFRAFERMLERHPELRERVTFLAALQPSRQDVPQYVDYLAQIESVVDAVNARYATGTWMPIDLRLVDDIALAIAAYKRFDVLMVNAVFDGMNLVAKEAVVVNERHGVLALSENTGASEELGAVAVTLHPFDIDQQADALFDAITMAPADRQARHAAAVDIVRTNSVQKWLDRQMADIELLGPPAIRG